MIVQGTRTTGAWQRRILVAATAGCLGVLLLGQGQAFAGACKHTKRISESVATSGIPLMTVETTVQDEAKYRNYDVVIMQDGKEVKSGTILARGANTKISKSVGGVKKSTFSVVISAAGDEEITSTCTYVVSIGSKGLDATTTWSLPDDADAACSGVINMFCNKSYRAGSWSWKTSLVIND